MLTKPPTNSRELVLGALLLINALSVSSSSRDSFHKSYPEKIASPPLQESARALLPKDEFQRMISGAETHTYQISLAQGQFVRIVVDQRGVDVVLTLSGPDKTSIAVDNPNGSFGTESVSILATAQSTFTIVVKTTSASQKGTYALTVEGPRDKINGDEERVRAERIFADAQQARRAGRRQEAIDKYTEVVALWGPLDDRQHQAYAFCDIGRIYRAMSQMKDSLDSLERALEYARSVDDIGGQAFVLNEMGATYRELGDPLQALPYYEKALALRGTLNDPLGRAQLFNNIGLVYAKAGQQKRAIDSYQTALVLWQQAEDPTNSARTLNNIADSYSDLGALSGAFDKLQVALPLSRKSKNLSIEASIWNNLGKIYDTWADSQHALDSYQRALSIFTELRDERGEATVEENIGLVYAGLSDTATAKEYIEKALKIRERLNEPRGTGIALNDLGFVQVLMGLNQEAMKNLNRSISYSRQAGNKTFEAYSLTNLGMSHFALGEAEAALRNYESALKIQKELEDPRGQAITLDKIGRLLTSAGRVSEAHARYDEALALWLNIGDKQGQALTLYGKAEVSRKQGDLEEARRSIEEAIDIVETVRAGMNSDQLRLTYFAAKEELYELDIDVRMQRGLARESNADIEAALYSSERSRARNLLDLLNVARAKDTRAEPSTDSDKAERLAQEMSSLRQSLWRLRATKRADDVAFVEERLSKLATERDEIRSRKAVEEHKELRPLTAPQIQALLDDDTLLLEYSLGTEQSYLWAVTRTKILGYALASRKVIETHVERFRRAITAYEPKRPGERSEDYIARLRNAATNYRQFGEALSREVLGKVWNQLGNKRLVIVADGALQYIPFGALPSGPGSSQASRNTSYAPLILTNQIVNEPSASTVGLLRTRPLPTPTKVVAVFADPVFDPKDPRVIGGTNPITEGGRTALKESLRDIEEIGPGDEVRLERLQSSAVEARAIGTLAPVGLTKLALNFEANRNSVLSSDLSQFRIIHFATHGVLNARRPELSGIVLSMVDERGRPQDGFLMLSDVYELSIPVELVVLSACQTGIGKQVRGEGLVALPRGFLFAGAKRVIASLWRVQDEATTELMKRFYRNLLVKNLTAPEALRRAQIDMLQNTDLWRAPFYWAGFEIQGEWR